jgi:hypothetical protein
VRGKDSIGANINSMELEREKGIHTFVSAPAVVSFFYMGRRADVAVLNFDR